MTATSKARIRIVLGGNRSGKSEFGVMEAISHALGYRPYLPLNHPARIVNDYPTKGRIIGEDFSNHIGGVIVPKLYEWVPKTALIKVLKSPQGKDVTWKLRHRNGGTSMIELMSYEQESDKFEGWDGDWVWFDEPPPRSIYIACWRGLIDRKGSCWFTMTPLKEPWINDELWSQRKPGEIEGWVFDIKDNIGYGLTEEAVADFERQLTDEEKTARLRGQFLHLSGIVYKEFNPQIHVVEPFDISADYSVYEAIDPHPRTPTAVVWLATGPDGTKYVFDELFKADSIQNLCSFMKVKRGKSKIYRTLIDKSVNTPDPITKQKGLIIREFNKYGIFPQIASDDLTSGILRIKQALKVENGKPEIYIFRNCIETIREFYNYIWDEYKGKSKDEKNSKNTPRDKDDHMLENLYRILLCNPIYVKPRSSGYISNVESNKFTGY